MPVATSHKPVAAASFQHGFDPNTPDPNTPGTIASVQNKRAAIRIGVLINGPSVAGWEYTILQRLAGDDRFDVCAFIEDATHRPKLSKFRRDRDWGRLPFNVANRLEAKFSARKYASAWPDTINYPDDAFEIATLGLEATTLKVMPNISKSGLIHRFSDGDLHKIRELNLDVMLRFGFNILRGDVLTAAKHGVWSFHHADHRVNRGSPAGFWEVAKQEMTTGTMLQRLTEDLDNGVVMRTAKYITMRSSWNENRRRAYAKSTVMMIDALSELANTGSVTPAVDEQPAAFDLFDRPLYLAPRPTQTIAALLTIGRTTVSDIIRFRGFEYRWALLVARGALRGQSLRRMQRLDAPKGTYWADPFMVTRNGETRVLFEDFDLSAERGKISSALLTDKGFEDIRTAFAPDYHLSYPFPFEFQGELYCMPESYQSGAIEVWKCTSFPDGWVKVRDMIANISAVDSTLVEHNGLWYMFTNIDRVGLGDHCDELHIFSTDNPLTGEWAAHPNNPVVSDAVCSRMGGAIVRNDQGILVRPAQRTGAFYGSGLFFREILELTPTTYVERSAEEISPKWIGNAVGLHHCHNGPSVSVLDICLRERRFGSRKK
jgi:hypothetical protein